MRSPPTRAAARSRRSRWRRTGALTLAETTTVSAGAHIIDEAVSANGRFLYVIADRTGQVYGFRIGSDGSLTRARRRRRPAGRQRRARRELVARNSTEGPLRGPSKFPSVAGGAFVHLTDRPGFALARVLVSLGGASTYLRSAPDGICRVGRERAADKTSRNREFSAFCGQLRRRLASRARRARARCG